ncbi:MAG: hypothetical protein OHK0022_34090 [Roseiflexaceae bacterium]
MTQQQAVLLRQYVKGMGMIFRLRMGVTGSGSVVAEWPAELSVEEAIAQAEQYGVAHHLVVVAQRAWLEWHLPRWPEERQMATPDGVGTVVDYDSQQGRYLVLLDGEDEPRIYYQGRLTRLRVMYLASELDQAAQKLVDAGVTGDVALREVVQALGATMVKHSDPHDISSGYREIWQLPDGLRINLWLSGLQGGAERAGPDLSLADLGVGFDFQTMWADKED